MLTTIALALCIVLLAALLVKIDSVYKIADRYYLRQEREEQSRRECITEFNRILQAIDKSKNSKQSADCEISITEFDKKHMYHPGCGRMVVEMRARNFQKLAWFQQAERLQAAQN